MTILAKASEDKIRERAYQLWDGAGRPEGREQEFWYDAQRELGAEDEVDTSAEGEGLDMPLLVPGRLS